MWLARFARCLPSVCSPKAASLFQTTLTGPGLICRHRTLEGLRMQLQTTPEGSLKSTAQPTGVASSPARARRGKAAAKHSEQAEATAVGPDAAEDVAPEPIASPRKRVAGAKKGQAASTADAAEPEGGAQAQEEKKKKPRSRKKSADTDAGGASASAAGAKEGKEEEEEEEEAPKKRARKTKAQAPSLPLYTEALRKPPPDGPHFKVLSWNVAGLRGLLKKDPGFLTKLMAREAPDIVCLQEIKCSDKHVEDLQTELGLPPGWHCSWLCSADKAGYSGVATFSRVPPVSEQRGLGAVEHDGEGRALVLEFKTFYMVNVYVPNSGAGLVRLDYRVQPGGWDESLANLVKKLNKVKVKPVLLTGDLNCAHKEIDIKNPKTNLKSAGFTREERDSFGSRYLAPAQEGGCGLVDLYRDQFPDTVAYTYYSYRFNCRQKGIGWRLDYFLATQDLKPCVYDTWLLCDVMGSDHIPLGVTVLGTLEG